MKFLFACLFMLVYITIGFGLAILTAITKFVKSIPLVWQGMTLGPKLKKQGLLSDEDMGEALEGIKEDIERYIDKAKTKEHGKPSLNPEDIGIWYGHKEGHD